MLGPTFDFEGHERSREREAERALVFAALRARNARPSRRSLGRWSARLTALLLWLRAV